MAELNWTDAQWQNVNNAVTEAFGKASVASAFLPMYGPLAGSAEVVRNERLIEVGTTISLDRDHNAVNLKLVNLTVNVELSSEQIADETLSNALLAFRRAANILALEQDLVVFAGYGRGFMNENSSYVSNQVGPQKGLADLPARAGFDLLGPALPPNVSRGQLVIPAVVKAMNTLERNSNPAPFACVLGDTLYEAVHDPSQSLVLPADRVTPMLRGGPLLRSGKIEPGTGIVVSLGANVVDIVVGTPPTVQFLQREVNAKFLFRVYTRFALRIRDDSKPPVSGFRITDQNTIALEGARLRSLRP
ncbi:encapsulin [Variovorax sp. GT1P44]|uniref:encapsulin n=1 Tax=Variovorax sp. GT1P44 TaxID=3443742 RepID=UPI003F46ECF4